MKLNVLKPFRDKFTKETYTVGQEIEIEDQERIDDIVERGLVEEVKVEMIKLFEVEFEKSEVAKALAAVGVKGTSAMKADTLIKRASELDAEKLAEVKEALGL